MKSPQGVDALDLLYAIDSLLNWKPLKKAGLNRDGYRRALRAQKWFTSVLADDMNTRIVKVKRRSAQAKDMHSPKYRQRIVKSKKVYSRKGRSSKRGIAPAL